MSSAAQSWGFLYDPTFTASELQSDILIGYPFPFDTPIPTPATPTLLGESAEDLQYYRTYMLDINSARLAKGRLVVIGVDVTESIDDLLYYRGYLGRT